MASSHLSPVSVYENIILSSFRCFFSTVVKTKKNKEEDQEEGVKGRGRVVDE